VAFGTAFPEFKDLSVDQDYGRLKLYTKHNEDLKLGLAKLSSIVYHFFDVKFYGVSIHTTDPANTQPLSPSRESVLAKAPSSIRKIPSGKGSRPGLSFRRIRPGEERSLSEIAN
jgi:hypothetical protein